MVQGGDAALRTSNSFATAVDLVTSSSVLMKSGRWYRCKCLIPAASVAYASGTGALNAQLSQDNGTGLGGTFTGFSGVSNLAFSITPEHVFQGDGLSHTFAVRLWMGASTNWNIHGFQLLTVEDITLNG
jgi:hypothetical protein